MVFFRLRPEHIEMTVLNSRQHTSSVTPPVQCSSRNSVGGGSSRGSMPKVTVSPADSMEYINKMMNDQLRPHGVHGKWMTYYFILVCRNCRNYSPYSHTKFCHLLITCPSPLSPLARTFFKIFVSFVPSNLFVSHYAL